MTDTTTPQAPTDPLEAARKDHPELAAEFERLRLWVGTCIGDEVASWGGPAV